MAEKLIPRFDSRKSFYGKAKVRKENGDLVLTSYTTDVARIRKGKAEVSGLYSNTTTRHIKEFLRQNNIKAGSTQDVKKLIKKGDW